MMEACEQPQTSDVRHQHSDVCEMRIVIMVKDFHSVGWSGACVSAVSTVERKPVTAAVEECLVLLFKGVTRQHTHCGIVQDTLTVGYSLNTCSKQGPA